MASTTVRQYDIVVLGATGYTASIAAEYITKNLPTDLKWAVAGRSESKLEALVRKLKKINGDRQEPGMLFKYHTKIIFEANDTQKLKLFSWVLNHLRSLPVNLESSSTELDLTICIRRQLLKPVHMQELIMLDCESRASIKSICF
jgi:hypothetical protein